MNKKGKLPFVPKLRFQEFHSTGEWKLKTLHSLATKITAKNNDTSLNRVLTNSAVDGVIDQRDFFDREITNKNNLDNYFIIDEGDYVYNPRISVTAPVGPISKNKVGKGIISPLYTVFRFKNQKNDFFEQYFKTNLWHKYLKSISNTGARYDRMSISIDDFMSLPLPYPSELEQQKIAECLTSIDDLINSENKKLETLEMHKKGLMQKLFPKNGEKVPALRFHEFKNAKEWQEKSIEDILNNESSTITLNKLQFVTNGYPVYGADGLVGFISNFNQHEDYIAIIKDGAGVGRLSLYKKFSSVLGTLTCLITKNEQDYKLIWLYYLLQTIAFMKYIKGSGIPHIYYSDYKKHIVLVPKIKEQQKIADCLSSLDDLIAKQTEKIESLKAHKKGLIQGLFPSIEEVTNE